MNWDETTIGIAYFGVPPLDTATPPAVHNIVSISKSDYDFEVKITSINGSKYTGVVLAIEPIVEQHALGIEAGQEVEFSYENIKSLHRKKMYNQ